MDDTHGLKFNNVILDSVFLEQHLVDTDGEYIKILLFVQSVQFTTVFEISEKLSLSLSKTYDGVAFWVERELLTETEGTVTPFVKAVKKVHFDERPEYDPMELKMYAGKNSDVKLLFEITQKHLGRFLTHNDLSGIFGIYSWLGLSIPVIDKLLTYCVENNHRNMRYIERVAMDWAENNITTPQQADEKIKLYNVDFRRIMKAMGQSGRSPIQKEEQYMTHWIKDLQIPLELIEYACEKTVINTGKAAFSYANKVLLGWVKEGVKTLADVQVLENNFSKTREDNTKVQTTKPAKKNKFVNFKQRTYDFDEYQRLEMERISKKQEGLNG